MTRAYFNENDPYCAAWLRNLIREGLIADGDVDERSIVDVRADDVRGYTQCHFFAGIGGWSLALRLAGVSDDAPVWTGSCPCQPLSSAGKRQGHADERHLWPAFHRLIAERKPTALFGEQVASKDGREWFSAVRADLEALGYAVGASDLCAAGVGLEYEETESYEWLRWAVQSCPDPALAAELSDFAEWAGKSLIWSAPHIRQRLWFVADADQSGGEPRELADADGWDARAERLQRSGEHRQQSQDGGAVQLGDSEYGGCEGRITKWSGPSAALSPSQVSFWSDCDWLPCTDGKARPVEPGTFPLASRIPGRVGRLRAYGNAIVPPLAAEFIKACG